MQNKIETIKLDNGLTICFYEDASKHSAHVNLVTKFGGLDTGFYLDGKEYQIPNGVAHMVEHLLIEKSPYQNLLHTFGEMQLSCNGATYTYHTRYYFQGVEKIEEALEILIKGINHPCFTKEDVIEVKPAIYEEIRRANDNKWKQLDKLGNKGFFKNIPYISTLGTIEDVKSITYEDVLNVHEAFYRPSNQILIVSGNFDKENIIQKTKTYFEEIPASTKPFQKKDYQEPKEMKEKILEVTFPTAEPIVSLLYKVDTKPYSPKEQVKLTYYFSYFLSMQFGITSPFYKELQEQNVILDSPFYSACKKDTYFEIEIGNYTKNPDILIAKIEERMQNPTFDEELFTMRKKEDKVEIAVRPESLGSTVEPYLENMLLFGYPYMDTIDDINAFSFEEFKEIMQKMDFGESLVCKMMPEEEKN